MITFDDDLGQLIVNARFFYGTRLIYNKEDNLLYISVPKEIKIIDSKHFKIMNSDEIINHFTNEVRYLFKKYNISTDNLDIKTEVREDKFGDEEFKISEQNLIQQISLYISKENDINSILNCTDYI